MEYHHPSETLLFDVLLLLLIFQVYHHHHPSLVIISRWIPLQGTNEPTNKCDFPHPSWTQWSKTYNQPTLIFSSLEKFEVTTTSSTVRPRLRLGLKYLDYMKLSWNETQNRNHRLVIMNSHSIIWYLFNFFQRLQTGLLQEDFIL